jgi:H+/Cl- antiporter ClcA
MVVAIVVFFLPEQMFAGEKQIFPMIHNPAQFGVMTSLLFALLKILLLALSFKSGYLGGPMFPNMIALMCLSTATAMFLGRAIKRLMARRAAGKSERSRDVQEE